jgi:ribosomal protein L12E/L44/L45/RPP1/RPP2
MLENIQNLIKEKWPAIVIDEFAIVKIIGLLKVENMDSISDIIVKYLKGKNTSTEIQRVQDEPLTYTVAADKVNDEDTTATDADENKYIEEMKKEQDEDINDSPYKKTTSDKKKFFTVLKQTDLEVYKLRGREVTKKVVVGHVVPVPAIPKIKRAITSGTENFEVTDYTTILMRLLEGQRGGGSASKNKDLYAYILFLIYLNSLINTLNGYEMMNGSDYMYFDAVARIVISAIQVTKRDYLSLLDTIYIEMLDTEWVDEFTSLENKDFKECVQVAAQNLALQSLNLRRGPIPYDTYNGSKKIFEDIRFDSEFKKITSTLKGKSFYDRKLYVISRIESYIKSSMIPSSTPMAPTAVPGFLRQVSHIPSLIKPSKEPLAGLAYGGSKTRNIKRKKRKNGSPRRKTLRKTHKHR